MITIYSKEGCPKCRVLKMKLEQKGLEYAECQDTAEMLKMGLKSLPVMMCVDGQLLKFEEAVKYVNSL